jgi:hypothetical protein
VNAASNVPDEGLPTGQITATGPGPRPTAPGRGGPPPGLPTRRPGRSESSPAAAGARAGDGNSLEVTRGSRARLLEGDELQRIALHWREIQAHFVDEPRTAVEQADALVADLMQQVAAMFAREHAELEHRWAGGDGASTEELRQSLRGYRSFFERLLAA